MGYTMSMTQTMNLSHTSTDSGIDAVSGLEYIEQAWAGEEVEIKIEAIEGDAVSLEVNATVHSVDWLDALIEALQARRTDLARAAVIAGQ